MLLPDDQLANLDKKIRVLLIPDPNMARTKNEVIPTAVDAQSPHVEWVVESLTAEQLINHQFILLLPTLSAVNSYHWAFWNGPTPNLNDFQRMRSPAKGESSTWEYFMVMHEWAWHHYRLSISILIQKLQIYLHWFLQDFVPELGLIGEW